MKNPTHNVSALNTSGIPTLFMLLISLLLSAPVLAQAVSSTRFTTTMPALTRARRLKWQPARTDLAGWTLVLYNGNNGAVYNTIGLEGGLPNQQSGCGTADFFPGGYSERFPGRYRIGRSC